MNGEYIKAVERYYELKREINILLGNKPNQTMFVSYCSPTPTESKFNLRELNKELINKKQ